MPQLRVWEAQGKGGVRTFKAQLSSLGIRIRFEFEIEKKTSEMKSRVRGKRRRAEGVSSLKRWKGACQAESIKPMV